MESLTILLVDDDLSILESIKIILENEGYRVLTATTGKAFMKIVKSTVPDLCIVDFSLPDNTGDNLISYMRGNPVLSNVPVVVISANARYRSAARQAGANDFIEKPFEISNLLNRIRKYLP